MGIRKISVDALIQEREALNEKLTRLQKTLESENFLFSGVNYYELQRLKEQYNIMEKYVRILDARIRFHS